MMHNVAAIQMQVEADVAINLAVADALIQQAVNAGAHLIVLPEAFAFMGRCEADNIQVMEELGYGPIQDFLSNTAKKYSIWLVAGTIPLKSDEHKKCCAACLVFDDQGQIKARYDKIHLFDVTVNTGESYVESNYTAAGQKVVVVDTPVGRLGLTVCYDLRFPELFRLLLNQGAELISVPSAFTAVTGRAHWEVLLRARAIENLCYIVAPDQVGRGPNGRETYGHSLIVEPWGSIVDQVDSGEGIALAEIDKRALQKIRDQFPSIMHQRLSVNPIVSPS